MKKNRRSGSSNASLVAGGSTSASIQLQGVSSISPRSAKNSSAVILPTRSGHGTSVTTSDPEVVAWSSSDSRMTRLYKSPEFRLTWDNDIAFHVAENAVNLRKFRK